jgi:hypothetical protein
MSNNSNRKIAASDIKSNNLKIAQALISAGIPIFPAKVVLNKAKNIWDKIPLVDAWPSSATTEADAVSSWWDRWPEAVPGIELGRAGLVIIDADRHPGGADGVAAFAELEAQCGALPPHPICETAGNGLHHYFRQPQGVKLGNGTGDLPSGIDARGNGGFAVAPGSLRSDGARWSDVGLPEAFDNGGLPELPGWLLLKIAGTKTAKPRNAAPPAEWSGSGAHPERRARDLVDGRRGPPLDGLGERPTDLGRLECHQSQVRPCRPGQDLGELR